MRLAALVKGERLRQRNELMSSLCFPVSGMVSTIVTLQDSRAIEAAMTGPEGMIDIAALGTSASFGDHLVQGSGEAYFLSAAHLFRSMASSEGIARMVCLAAEVAASYTLQSLACANYHQIESRFCRWLLMARFHGGSDHLELTHEFIAVMLGAQRSSISVIAAKLQDQQIIDYSRGHVTILDAKRLKELCCECYDAIVDRIDLAFPPAAAS